MSPINLLTTPKINQSGFYWLDATSPDIIDVDENLVIHFFDATAHCEKKTRKIIVGANSEVALCGYMYDTEYDIEFVSGGERCKIDIAYLLASKNSDKVKSKIVSRISHSHSSTNVSIVSFAGEQGNISVDGVVEVSEGCKDAKAYLREDNIFLDSTGKIRSIPGLLIRSNDVQAGHSARVEKMSDEKLFYLLGR